MNLEKRLAEIGIRESISRVRKKRGLTQKALADLMGVSQPVVAELEAPQARNVKLGTLVRAADALGVRLAVRFVDEKKGRQKSTRKAS